MSFRLILHIPRGTIKLLLYIAVGLAVLLIALTRTQVGRDGLRAQIERQFDSTFEGRLQIGQLRGNLLNTLYANNIQLMDSTGVLVASIDAAVLQPTWLELLSGTVSLHSITLIQPEFNILLQDDTTWNLSDVFRKRNPDARPPLLGGFTSSDIKIMDGTLHTNNVGVLPASVLEGSIFNYAEATFSNIQAQLNVEWQGDSKLFDVDLLSFYIEEKDVELAELHGQMLWSDDRIELNEVFLESEKTKIEFTGFIDQPGLIRTAPDLTTVNIELGDSRLDAGALGRLFPTLSLADTLNLTSHISGPLNALDVQMLKINSGQLDIQGDGYIQGFPDSLSFIAFVSNSTLSQPDLKRILPDVDFSFLNNTFSPYLKTLQLRGAVKLVQNELQRPHYGRLDFEMQNDGALAGEFEFSGNPGDSLLAFNAHLDADSVHLGAVLNGLPSAAAQTVLNGTVALQGAGSAISHLFSEIKVQLEPSVLAGIPVDTLETFAYYENGIIDLQTLISHQAHGTVGADAVFQLDLPEKIFQVDLRVAHLNVGSVFKHDSLETNLDAVIKIKGSGATLENLRGSIEASIDPSELTLGDLQQHIPQHQINLSFYDLANGQQSLTLESDIANARLDGVYTLADIASTGKNWGRIIKKTADDIFFKTPITPEAPALTTNTFPADSFYAAVLTPDAEIATSPDTLVATADTYQLNVQFKQPSLIQSWLPAAPYIATNATARFEIKSLPSTMSIIGKFTADSLFINDLELDHLDGNLSFSSDLNQPAETRLSLNTYINADSLKLLGQVLPQPLLSVDIAGGEGYFNVATKSNQRLGPQRLKTHINILPDRNRVLFEDLFLSIGNSSWTTYGPAHLDMIGQTLVIPGIELQSKSPEANILQSVHLSGILSPNPSDTAAIHISNIAIRPISQFLNMGIPLGGLISGQMDFTTTNDQPEITGTINVDRLSLDNRVLGDVNISSRYLPGEPNVGLQIALTPIISFNQEQYLPDAVIPAFYEENELSINGTFRLPKFNKKATGFLDAGALDLDLNLYRADVFFFEYIFPNLLGKADGYLTGGGKITGSFDYPVFDARLDLKDGKVEIPRFNLQYTDFTGELYIDKNAIRLEKGAFKDLTGGAASFAGDFLFNDYRYFSFDLKGSLDELLIMNQDYLAEDIPFYGQIWGSGSLTLTGPAFNALLISTDAVTKASSELFIPVTEDDVYSDVGFLIIADSTGQIPDINQLTYRKNLLSKRPEGERKFIDGLSIDLNIFAPSGSTVHLVFDPLLGDAMNAVSSGRIQIQRREGEFATYGTLNVESGDYLFTAGDVFARRFLIDRGGTITWDGDPIDARLKIPASYRTRASVAGLPTNAYTTSDHIPLIVQLDISGRVSTPAVDLSLRADRSDRSYRGNYEAIEAILNQSERLTDYATSVLLTNSFLLTTENTPDTGTLTNSGNQIAFTSVSQLVASQLNRFLGEALPNVDLNLGLQGESLEDPEVTYGVALYLLDQRLVIRGQGIYQNEITPNQPDLEGEFEVEVRLGPSVSVSVFLRREGDLLAENSLTSTRGAGLSYQTQFSSWGRFFDRLFGWIGKKKPETPTDQVAISPDE